MKTSNKIAVVIVNYKTPELVKDCLASLKYAVQQFDMHVVIGDADSQDDSVAIISAYIAQEEFGWATCFAIGSNGGFAYGNNHIVTRYVLPDPDVDLVYFLNPDTYIRPGAVEALTQRLQTQPDAGIVGSRLENPDGTLRAFGFRAPTPWREFFRAARFGVFTQLYPQSAIKIENLTHSQKVDWVTGASFMVRRSLLETVGLMDDGYFLYFEETDLMTRARKLGYDVWHEADSHVVHLAGQSTGVRTDTSMSEVASLSPFWLASRRRYLRKHHGVTGLFFANVFFLAGDLVYRVHRSLRGRKIENPPALWAAYLRRHSHDR